MSKVIGLTGGIASGKSTVSAYLKSKGYRIIDADALVHDLQQKGGPLYQVLVQTFRTGILDPSGQLDRPALAALLFSQPDQLALSAQLQDPIIRQALAEKKAEAQAEENLVFMDIPLLFEKGYAEWFETIWLVYLSAEEQEKRLMARNQLTQEEARDRLRSQWPLSDKRVLASQIIDNSGSLSETYDQIDDLLDMEERNDKYSDR